MQYIGKTISSLRATSNNEQYSATTGITDSEMLQYLNDAQDRLQSLIDECHVSSKPFVSEVIIPIVSGQEGYSLTERLFFNKEIEQVEYSATGATSEYFPLEKISFINRYNGVTSGAFPTVYYRRLGNIYINPPASTGYLRVLFERTLDDLDLRRAQVNGTPSGTDIDLTVGSGPTTDNEALFVANEYICISDAFGNPLLYNGVISSYVPATDVLTLAANVSTYLVSGKTLADLANGYLTVGQWTTTHSKLPDDCERYMRHYTILQVYNRDASNLAGAQSARVAQIEKDIKSTFATQTGEIQYIPQVDFDEWW